MDDIIFSNQAAIRLGSFFFVIVGMAVWETVAPRRERQLTRRARWPHNIGIVVINTLLVRVLFPGAAVGMAFYVESRGWGLLSDSRLPHWILVPLCVVILDFAIYLQVPGGSSRCASLILRRSSSHTCGSVVLS